MNRRGIPTTYRGTRTRSLLEATWLAFADLIGLEWTYEPALPSAGYIPDLLLGDRLLCEIRPFTWHLRDDGPLVAARDQVAPVAAQHGLGAAVLGLDPFACEWWDGTEWTRIGPRWTPVISRGDLFVQFGPLLSARPLRHLTNSRTDIASLWRTAASRVQWRPRKLNRPIARPEGAR
ncbi:MAG TPA: hypothetical protein VG994_02735 [Steroidobacteraceae bacterium]|nr:hypothetical protein [Steroidobacteraceae bacterium]